ncbi:MAG: hypothetical protein J6I47_10630 [Ruminococcus sp.]|nr:hypothetical protein [Ruminococcus sp.]
MDITLVTTSFNDEVHGTDNDKKTGCGINLMKPENVIKYRRGNYMTDLKEITCEKCKAVLAKKIIKSDKKEMDRLIKEERLRAKKGFVDEGIVPLGNTTAKITKDPREEEKKIAAAKAAAAERKAALQAAEEEERAREEATRARREAEEAERAAREAAEEEARAAAQRSIPGTGVAMDDSLAQFAINVPEKEEEPQDTNSDDDFLAQFAVEKPKEEEKPQIQDDFLAQFAVPTPEQPEPVQEAPQEEYVQPVSRSEENIINVNSEEDIMKMFSLDGQVNNFSNAVASAVNNTQPEVTAYESEPDIIDVEADELRKAEAAAPQIPDPEPEVDLSTVSEWDMVANQIFGYANSQQEAEAPETEQTEMDELPTLEETEINAPAQAEVSAPVIDDIPVPQPQVTPAFEEIPAPQPQPQAAPMFGGIPTPQPQPQAAPVFDEIPVPQPQPQTAPMFGGIPTPQPQPQAAPVFDEIPVPQPAKPQAAPVFDEIPVPQPAKPQAAPVFDEIPVPQPAKPQAAPVIEDIPMPALNDMPTENNIEENGEDDMNKYRYSTPVFADEIRNTQPAPAPVQPAKNDKKAAPEQPQIISVPQFAGYDANGQPVYTYVQMQMAGVDANGQPIFAPLPGQSIIPPVNAPQPQAAPKKSAAAAKAPAAAAPQQPAPAPSVAQKKAAKAAAAAAQNGTPSANISKIAVNPHSKSTSQSFINAIANSKNYAEKSLIETQGLKANAPLLTSIEDVLSQMGDDSLKKKNAAAAAAQKNVPVYEEYKGASKSSSRSSAPKKTAYDDDIRFMTKAELKAKKKQDKIDAKFKKDMAKRGL